MVTSTAVLKRKSGINNSKLQEKQMMSMMATSSVDGDSIHGSMNALSEVAMDDDEAGKGEALVAELAHDETRAVKCLRAIVIVSMLGATAAVSTLVYFYTHNAEVSEFEETFHDHAEQIVLTVDQKAQNKLEAVVSIALMIQAYAINSGATWPNCTVPFFEEHIMATKSLTDAYGVQLFPIVTKETRAAWEEYSVQNRDWLNSSYFAQREAYGEDKSQLEPGETSEPGFNWFDHLWGEGYYNESNPDFSSGISSSIFGTTFNSDKHPIIDPDEEGPFFPQWQTSPASWYYQSTVNSNYGNFEDFFNQSALVMETGNAAFGMAWSDSNVPGYISTMIYPIFDKFYGVQPKVSAFLSIDLFWEAFLERILPPNADGIYVVIDNAAPCNQAFTFQIFGEDAIFVGDGDLHEDKFDSMGVSFLFGSMLMEPVSEPTYVGQPLYDDFCPYTFHIYPSKEMEDRYVTSEPIIYTVIVCLVFLFSSLVFVLYDFLVERRQHVVMTSANNADAVVSSLFPSEVKEKLYQEKSERALPKPGQRAEKGAPITEFMGVANPAATVVSPIAKNYPETTIMFADLVGFTAFSASRNPEDVFLLLESIYGRFDDCARKRGVFKVETIGDCYVAVTGLPQPQKAHALIMTKFADDCRCQMRAELHNLVASLGPKVLDLALRIGLHSGPVTAGVLRGDKARFQLFGDSMNTAARMEAHSKPNRIHVSESTANLLREAGKGGWVTPRKKKIVPKGKQEMQTYFVDTRSGGRSSTSGGSMIDSSSRSIHADDDAPLKACDDLEIRHGF